MGVFHNRLLSIEGVIVAFLQHQIFLAPILLLTVEEAGIPIPVPGDFIIIYTGYQVSKGIIPYAMAFTFLLIAVLLGSTILYFLSARYGQAIVLWFGKYIHLDERKLITVEDKFKKYGPLVIIFGRHIPGFRIPITIFSGMSEISYKKFIMSTFISVVFWIVINLSIGQRLGPKAIKLLHTHHILYFFAALPILLTAIWYLFLHVHAKRKRRHKKKQNFSYFTSRKLAYMYAVVAILIAVAGLAWYMYFSHFLYSKPMPETEKNSMEKIPPDVRRTLEKNSQMASGSATLRIPILMYHYVEYVRNKKDKKRQSLNVNPDVLELQIQTLLHAGYTFITAKELGDIFDGEMQLPKNPIILTFDDGHWDLDSIVVPILKKYHINATAYIVPGFIGRSDFLSAKQLQDVINSGLVDVGAHTVHHIPLKGKALAKVQYEVDASKIMLERTYHIHVYSFAYPYGAFDKQAMSLVMRAGFTSAASTILGVEQNQQNKFFLYRLRPGYRTGEQLLRWLRSVK